MILLIISIMFMVLTAIHPTIIGAIATAVTFLLYVVYDLWKHPDEP